MCIASVVPENWNQRPIGTVFHRSFAIAVVVLGLLVHPAAAPAGEPTETCRIGRSPADASNSVAIPPLRRPLLPTSPAARGKSPRKALDPGRIALLSWNVHKESHDGLTSELVRLARHQNLVLLQEARLDSSVHYAPMAAGRHSAARGWAGSGVLTSSSQPHLNACRFRHREPLLRTPKAALITEYGLAGVDETLLVVNVHMVNFTIGTRTFRRQLRDLHTVISRHAGPLILAGDFNTWRDRRIDTLATFTARLGMEPVPFADDGRSRVFGRPLDHIFIRGLEVLSSAAVVTGSSDHNAIRAMLRLRTAEVSTAEVVTADKNPI